MLTRRLTSSERAPSARPQAVGYLPKRRLVFDKLSKDESGKCDAEATGRSADRVYGVVFELSEKDRARLDEVEGLGHGYDAERVEVVIADGLVEAVAYVATKKIPGLPPYHWYKALVVAGAEEHGLPGGYVARLRTTVSQEDPDPDRRTRHELLLTASWPSPGPSAGAP